MGGELTLIKLTSHGEEKELDDAPDALLRMRNSLLNMGSPTAGTTST